MYYRNSRDDDDLHLEWLQHRQNGHGLASIARAYGVKSERVRSVLGKIKHDYAKSACGDDVFGGKFVQ